MNTDYYHILGVNPSADLETIKKAFRRKVMECHPDRGGSHEQMILVNQAWEILSNPEFRQHYDTARNQAESLAAQKTAEADAQTARQRAENYPRQWKDVEPWLNDILKDFVNAKYGSSKLPSGSFSSCYSFPTAGDSISGWLFILIGAALVLFGGIYFLDNDIWGKDLSSWIRSNGKYFKHPIIIIPLLLAPLWVGAWAGVWIHMLISEVLKNSVNEQPNRAQTEPPAGSNSGQRVLACDKCSQKLRVPSMQTELLVTCRSCGHKFACPPA